MLAKYCIFHEDWVDVTEYGEEVVCEKQDDYPDFDPLKSAH